MKARVSQKQLSKTSAVLSAFLMGSLVPLQGVLANELTKALEEGKPVLDVRVRAEFVEQDPKEKAKAVIARTRVGYMSGSFSGLKGYFEFENVTAIKDDYDSKTNFKTQHPVVADPEGSEVNQVFLSYDGVKDFKVKLGRQRMILDNARFVGNVGWRQNEQTYDAALINASMIKGLSATYAFVSNINGITGTSAETDTHLLNVSYKGLPGTMLTAYSYLIDMETGTDNKTIGARAKGKIVFNPATKLGYAIEYAQMNDYADNTSGNSASYYMLEVGATVSKLRLKLGHEVLGGDGTTSFSTPLATKHKFNGWADKFLGTPVDGLVDTSLTAVGKVSGVKLLASYHLFSSDNGGDDYGSELDLLAVKKFGKHYSAGVKYANYMEADYVKATDTSKIWLWGGIKF